LNRTNWKEIAELFGIAAIIASLVFVGLQLKQSQSIALNEVAVAVEANEIELFSAFRADWSIWQRGNAGDDLEPSDEEIYRGLIYLQHWHYQNVWNEYRRYDLESSMTILVADFIAFLNRNPGARKTWRELSVETTVNRRLLMPDYSDGAFESAVNAALDQLDRS
jgi:hypothetical protein